MLRHTFNCVELVLVLGLVLSICTLGLVASQLGWHRLDAWCEKQISDL